MHQTESLTEQITAMLRSKYNELDASGAMGISTGLLADEVWAEIDPNGKSPLYAEHLSKLELRQLARAICRAVHTQSEHQSEEGDLFDFKLQSRYPATRNGDDVYVLREELTYDERMENVARLLQEADAKSFHARALEAETEVLVRRGVLQKTQEDVPSA